MSTIGFFVIQKNTKSRYVIKYFLTIFLPIMCLVSTFLLYTFTKERNHQREITAAMSLSYLKGEQQLVSSTFESISTDLLTLSVSHELMRTIESGVVQPGLSHDLLHFSEDKRVYDQIRYLNETGQEVVRINFNNGDPVVVPKENLQNKGKRYYFKDAFRLNKGEVFVSPFDLNVENGQVEQPLKPMIRFGTPVFDDNGAKYGVFLINYLGAELLKNVDEMNAKTIGRIIILNSEGYWLKSHDPDKEWGFMYQDKKEMTFAKLFSETWKKIVNSDEGQIAFENGLITFSTMYPILESNVLASSTGSGLPFEASKDIIEGKSYFWKIIHYFPADELKGVTESILQDIYILFYSLCILLAFVSWGAALAMARKRESINALARSEERHRLVTENANDIVWQQDLTGQITFLTPSWERLTGYSVDEGLGMEIKEILTSDSEANYSAKIMQWLNNDKEKSEKKDEKASLVLELEHLRKDKSRFWGEVSAKVLCDEDGNQIGITCITRDITDRKEAEYEKEKLVVQLRQAHKIEAIGTMAGGIAHNFNNILGAILGYAEMAQDEIPVGNSANKYLAEVLIATNRASKLVKQIQVFSDQASSFDCSLQPVVILQEYIDSISDDLPENITVVQEINSQTDVLRIDDRQFMIIAESLFLNALYAMRESGGELGFKLENVELKRDDLLENLDVEPGRFVKLTVSDTGQGIPTKDLGRIFDPFFTTKKIGEGDGIGLSVAHGIVRKSGGVVKVESEVGKGTAIDVYLAGTENGPAENEI